MMNLQADRPYTQEYQALEQGLAERRALRALAHDHGAELAVVSNEHNLCVGGWG